MIINKRSLFMKNKKFIPILSLLLIIPILSFVAKHSTPDFPSPDSTFLSIQETSFLPESSAKETIPVETTLSTTPTSCFTYEELPDGTLRIIRYDPRENSHDPYHVTIPAIIDGKPVSTLGEKCLALPDIYSQNILELTISEGITTLEANLLEYIDTIYQINIPDSVTFIDEKAFQDTDRNTPHLIAIGCNDTSYAYQYAVKNDFACHIFHSVKPENNFLTEYRDKSYRPYYCHYQIEGQTYHYTVIEYLDFSKEWDNEFLVLVQDKTSKLILQYIDSSCVPEEKCTYHCFTGVDYRNFVSFADWNFDGTEDLRCYKGSSGTGALSHSDLYLYDKESSSYLNLPEFSNINNPVLYSDKTCIRNSFRISASGYREERYEYQNENLVCVAQLTVIHRENDCFEITDERLIDGKWQVYQNGILYSKDESEEDIPTEESYPTEQSTILYQIDSYWD